MILNQIWDENKLFLQGLSIFYHRHVMSEFRHRLKKLRRQLELIIPRFRNRLRIASRYYFHRSEKQPVFVIAQQRTGSSLLISYLQSIPSISFLGDILTPYNAIGIRPFLISKRAVIRHVSHTLNDGKNEISSVKLMTTHMELHGITAADLKAAFPNAKFIILYRRSLLDQYMSLQIATITDSFRWGTNYKLPPFIHINVSELTRYCQETKKIYQDIFQNAWLKKCSAVITYEDLASNPQGVFNEILFPFFGISSVQVSTAMRKQNTRTVEDLVINYEEVRPFLDEPWICQEYQFETPQLNEVTTE